MPAHRVAAPRPIEAVPPYRFPVVVVLAPVIAALVIYGVTGSSFALVFAALGPITAVASLVDARWSARRQSRRERERFAEQLHAALARVDEAHTAERMHLGEAHPSIAGLIASVSDPGRWRAPPDDGVLIRLGRGSIASAVRVEGAPADDDAFASLVASAALVRDAPVLVDARLGLGIVGDGALAQALARSALAQLARALPPREWRILVPEGAGGLRWMLDLPHPSSTVAASALECVGFEPLAGGESITVVRATSAAELPPDRRVVISVENGVPAITVHPNPDVRAPFVPEVASVSMAQAWARRLHADAARGGLVDEAALLPDSVALASLLEADAPAEGGLACVIGVAREPVSIDLVRDGPHAVIGGTTGSGKSELLVSWVLALAHAYPPSVVTVLLVDFKGGSAFSPLEGLPHTVGVITDLDAAAAARALASLSAELRHRERLLAEAGVRDIAALPQLARLVIVVDEFAAMLAEHPDLHALFADISARGRSLGVHLILCTQRPSGIVRDAVLANADLRISLRVNNRADSVAVVGDDTAAAIEGNAVGRGVMMRGGASPRLIQFALSDAQDARRVALRWPVTSPVRRPWCEPLPTTLAPSEVPPHAFGLLDLPEQQRRDLAIWDPHAAGAILVLGTQSSGKTTALAALARGRGDVRWLPSDPVSAWDLVAEVHDGMARDAPGETLLVIDDVDALLARFSPEHRVVVVERLVRILREGARSGIHVALSARRLTAEMQPIAHLASARLLLAHANRQDWILSGGDGATYLQHAAPGAGVWRDHRVQVVLQPSPRKVEPSPLPPIAGGPLAIVAMHPAGLRERFATWHIVGPDDIATTSLDDRTVVLGDPDEWQSRWGALQLAARSARVVMVGCSTADFRALTRSRDVPPPLPPDPSAAWIIEIDGSVVKMQLPKTMDSAQQTAFLPLKS